MKRSAWTAPGLPATVFLAAFGMTDCRKPASEAAGREVKLDSAKAVVIAMKAVDAGRPNHERTTLEVYSFRSDSFGFHISLEQMGGGGQVWIGPDGEVKEVVLGQ
jgi:hypothetical protein